jgi:hypothetical protein
MRPFLLRALCLVVFCDRRASARAEIVDRFEERHPLEDINSWELHQQRSLQEEQSTVHRRLASYVVVEDGTDEGTPYVIKHKKLKSHIPFAGGDTTHGMMIDA